MADGRRNNKGTKGNKGGRPPKSEERKLIERLTPLEDEAHAQLKKAVEKGQRWAIQMYFNYMYGKPKESVNINPDNDFHIPITQFFGIED